MIRPYLPPPRRGRATVRPVPRSRGKPPPEVSAELRSGAIAIVADRAERGKRPMAAAALAAELGVAPRTARAILDELRAAELAPGDAAAWAQRAWLAASGENSHVEVATAVERCSAWAMASWDCRTVMSACCWIMPAPPSPPAPERTDSLPLSPSVPEPSVALPSTLTEAVPE